MWMIFRKLFNKVLKGAKSINKNNNAIEISMIILLGSILFLFQVDLIPLKINGYFCGDISLKYPYVPVKKSKLHVVCEGVILSLIAAVLVEVFKTKTVKAINFRQKINLNLKRSVCDKINFFIMFLLVGCCVNEILTNMLKHTIGRLRPYFIDLCNSSVTCLLNKNFLYIENYTCQNKFQHHLKSENYQTHLLNARKSFPSGLASNSFYIATFCLLYIEHRLSKRNEIRLIRNFFQVMVIGWALWVSWGRVEKHHNHISDVAAGMLIGSVVATLAFHIFKMNRKLRNTRKTNRRYVLQKASICSI